MYKQIQSIAVRAHIKNPTAAAFEKARKQFAHLIRFDKKEKEKEKKKKEKNQQHIKYLCKSNA